jgi:hypothetical protein
VFFGPLNPRWGSLKDMTPMEALAGTLLIASIVIMGVWWSLFTDRIDGTVTQFLMGVTG